MSELSTTKRGCTRWGFFLVGLSFTFMLMPVQTLALEALSGEALAKASSPFLSTRQIFYAVGAALVTTLFVERTQSRAADLINQGMALIKGAGIDLSTPGGVASPRAIDLQIATQAGTWAVQSIFWLIFFGSLGLIVLALLLPGRKRQDEEAQMEEVPEPSAADLSQEQLARQPRITDNAGEPWNYMIYTVPAPEPLPQAQRFLRKRYVQHLNT